jgi:hypothetical protein
MEPLALLAILVAIVCVGYGLLNIALGILSTVITVVQANKFAVALILALIVAFWFVHHQSQ